MVWSGGCVGIGGGQLAGMDPPPSSGGEGPSISGGVAAGGLEGAGLVQHTPNF